jgi:CubicO group peptidase (beta-lactamase class C family)
MKNITGILITLFILKSTCTFSQIDKKYLVESNLMNERAVIFEDSIYAKYSIEERMKFYKIPSVSIAVINDGKIEWANTYGYADIVNKRLANVNTLYQVASISKSINGWAFMKLVEEGRLSSEKDIREYLKSWQFPDNQWSKGKRITIKNLLSHTAGLSVRGYIGYSLNEKIPTINQILNGEKPANNEAVVPIFEPNTRYQYSGGGYTIFRKVLDDNISSDYDKLMRNLVLKPLKMSQSTFNQPLSKKYKNIALGYDANAKPLVSDYYVYPDKTAGGLWSSASDIAKFILEIQNSLNNKKSILSKKSTIEMLTPILDQYAIGFGIDEKGGEKYFRHEGENYGFRSIFYGSFSTGKGVVILSNAYPENGKPFIYELLNSVASVYNWEGFNNTIKKKLVKIAEQKITEYVGEYLSENPPIKISITKSDGGLLLTARNPEKMYPTSENTFFLLSSPNDECIFSSSKNDGVIDTFEVKQNGNVMIKAIKKTK